MLGSGRHKIETEDIRGITVLSSIWWENVKYLMEKTYFGNFHFSIKSQIVKQTSYIPMGLTGNSWKKTTITGELWSNEFLWILWWLNPDFHGWNRVQEQFRDSMTAREAQFGAVVDAASMPWWYINKLCSKKHLWKIHDIQNLWRNWCIPVHTIYPFLP